MTSPTPVLPVLHDDFFVPDAIDFNMTNNPGQALYTFADFDSKGTKTISHLEFGRAAHRVAHLLRPERNGVDGEVVALVSLSDTVLYQPLIDSIKTHAKTASISNLKIEEMPAFTSVYPYFAHETTDHLFKPYPPPVQRPLKNDICLYLHSSGSTGYPRPIPLTQIYWTLGALPADLKEHNPRLRVGSMFMPGFHCFGIGMQLFQLIFGVLSIGVYPPNSALAQPGPPLIPSPENVLEHMKLTESNALIAPPTFLQIWAFLPDALEYLQTLEFVTFGGGPLSTKVGNLLVDAGVRLFAMYGATEFGMATRFIPIVPKYDWEYMQFHEHQRLRWVPQGDGTFECQFLSWERHQTMVDNLPDENGYATSDLWIPHPTDKSLWKIVGRIDDVIIHSSGEKTVPGPMEAIVISDPLVRDAIMFGRERDQAGILIEPQSPIDVQNQVELAALRNKIWSSIEEANAIAPAYSRIFKEMILISSKEKPLPRAGKGTILRKAAVKLYEEEINAIYENVKAIVGESSSPPSWSVTDIEAWLLEQVTDLISGGIFNPTADLFEQGFDSLYATSLRLRVANALRSSNDLQHQKTAESLSPNLVYSFPVINDLATYLSSLTTSPEVDQDAVARGITTIDTMIAKYTLGFETSAASTQYSDSVLSPAVVLLTGSTGNLGSQILAMLLEDSLVHKVYAYNRPSKAGTKTILERHSRKFEDVGLNGALLNSEKLVLIEGDATQPGLGLDQEMYSHLRESVNVVIHNAWRLDFNLSLASYEPNIQGTRHFIDLVRSSPNSSNTRFLFISSIAAVQHWDKSKGEVPEDVTEDAFVALGSGYGEAKHVCERILLKSGLQSLSLRLGQISGGRPKGVWPTTEWLPILVKSSVSLGLLPDTPGTASWLGADTISATIVDVALSTHSTPFPRALNLVHPRPVQQSSIIGSIRDAIAELLGHNLKLVPFSEWFAMVEERASDATAETWATVPAVKLLEFFRNYAGADASEYIHQSEAGGLPSLSTEKVQRLSACMHPGKLQQIGYEDAKLWVSYWHETGFLN
ncbi:putative secondary metabolism biosynthetic enzyme [Blastosporella zonata]|nr:putative secondary metabolism biosynthetic enzyme [Blastosporella zonata]